MNIKDVLHKSREALEQGVFIEKALKKILRYFTYMYHQTVYFCFFHIYRVKDNIILFYTFQGKFTCNSKHITEELMKHSCKCRIIWCMDSEAEMQEVEKKHAGIHCVKRGSFEFFRSLAQAKIIITNSNFIYPPGFHTCIRKQKNKVIVQTWHGSLGIKQLNTTPRLKSNLKAGKRMDFIISNSSFETEVYRESYWKTAKILEYGHPRNDMLINSSSEYVSRLKRDFYNMYNISPDTKLCLYAPTFPLTTVNSIYTIDYEMLMQALTVCFGKNWLILNRLHHRSIMSMKFNSVPEYCLDVSNYPDIQELMLIINVGVTDYSSWIYDFVLTRKPGFIFAPDIQQYDQIRGFYYPITETPFPVAYDNSMLYKNIISFNDIAYQTNIDSFLAAKGCIEDGKASKRVVELIEKILNN